MFHIKVQFSVAEVKVSQHASAPVCRVRQR